MSRLFSQLIPLGIACNHQISICFPLMVNREKLQHWSWKTAQDSAAQGAENDLTTTTWLHYWDLSSWQIFGMNCCIKILAIFGEVDGVVLESCFMQFFHTQPRCSLLTSWRGSSTCVWTWKHAAAAEAGHGDAGAAKPSCPNYSTAGERWSSTG